MILGTYLYALLPMLLIGFLFWLISVFKKDVSIVDSLWSLFFIVACGYAYQLQEQPTLRSDVLLFLVVIWAVRLSGYITLRHWGQVEDHRYQTIRENNQPGFQYKSLYLIFGFQAIVAWIIALPLFIGINSDVEFSVFDMIGMTLWCMGMYFESVSDYQLWKFKKNTVNSKNILTQGLWKYSRHPNYFGEFLIWWGYFCFAISVGGYFTIISPLLMTFLLLKFSGVGLLEKTMKLRPGYEEYMKSTNAFLPGLGAKGKS